jgi:flagellar protein FlgJ
MSNALPSNFGNVGVSGAGVLDQRLSLDVQGVDALRRTARTSPQEGAKQAAKQFEVMFMQMMLKSMREATPSDGLLGGQQEKTYTSMLDQQLAQNLSGRGLGLAEAMLTQLNRAMAPEGMQPLPGAAAEPAGRISPAGALSVPAEKNSSAIQNGYSVPPVRSRAADLSLYEAAGSGTASAKGGSPTADIEDFMSKISAAAQRASQESGVPAQLIMAQAALESGWGKRQIRAEDGSTSYNLFGIKAGKNWKGSVVNATTTEYVDGVAQKTKANFRAYGSYDEAFSDYARFMVSNPRYANVVASSDAVAAAHGLQRAGYATDPQYGGKLVRIMKQMT